MSDIFLKLFNMSVAASWLVLVVLGVRLLFRKAPKWFHCLLWGFVAVRLVVPFSFESIFSLIPSTSTISPYPSNGLPFEVETGIPPLDSGANAYLKGHYYEGVTVADNFFEEALSVVSFVWIVGLLLIVCYGVISYVLLKRRVCVSLLYRDNIYYCDEIASPFILGVVQPKIYIPSGLSDSEMYCVIRHENAHLQRNDHLWKPFAFVLLAVYWFNPVMWLAYVLLCRDIEKACDERVIKGLPEQDKRCYAETLVTCSSGRRMIMICPLAFGEVGVKDRIKSVLHYKKPTVWILIVSVIVSLAIGVFFLTDPIGGVQGVVEHQKSGSDVLGVTVEIVGIDTSGATPLLEVAWKDRTTYGGVTLGEEFYIYYDDNGTWVDCREMETAWAMPAYMIPTNGVYKKSYSLGLMNMSRVGTYRFESFCTISGATSSEYTVWVEFELMEPVQGISSSVFRAEDLVYANGMYSYIQPPASVPLYRFVNGKHLLRAEGEDWIPLGDMIQVTLDRQMFDSRVVDSLGWAEGVTLEEIRKNNRRVWELRNVTDTALYLLLEQNDGSFYFAQGYYSCGSVSPRNEDDSHIRWLYRMEIVGDTPSASQVYSAMMFNTVVSWANYAENDTVAQAGFRANGKSDSQYPVATFESLQELMTFRENFADVFDMTNGYDEVLSTDEVIDKRIDHSLFEDHTLYVVYIPVASGSFRFGLKEVEIDDKLLRIHVSRINDPEVYTEDMAGWFLFVPIERSLTAYCSGVEAVLVNP